MVFKIAITQPAVFIISYLCAKLLYMLKIGHRGTKGHIAENTLEFFAKAIVLGANGIELDVHVCATCEIVVMHDFTVNRTTNGSGNVSEFTLHQLKELTIEGKYLVPTLKEVLNTISNKVFINIELKGSGTAQPVAAILTDFINNKGFITENLIVSSFNYNELQEFKNCNTGIPIGVLTENSIEEAAAWAEKLSAKAIHPYFELLTKENIFQMQQAGYRVMAWTVNEHEDIAKMKLYRVDGIISDYPERL